MEETALIFAYLFADILASLDFEINSVAQTHKRVPGRVKNLS